MADANEHINYDLADIERYLQGSMTAEEMHNLERAALQDPFLADAIEGYSYADTAVSKKHLAEIAAILGESGAQHDVIVMPKRKSNAWRVAASIMLLVGVATAGYYIFSRKNMETSLAKNESAAVHTLSDSASIIMQQASPAADTPAYEYPKKENTDENSKPISADKKTNSIAEEARPKHKKIPAPYTTPANKNTERADARASAALTMKAPAITLIGNIVDNKQRPVANATIVLADSTRVLTDRDGNFSINTPDSEATANIEAFGYKPLSHVRISKSNNRIVLKEKPFILSDVQVTNIGQARKKVTDTSAIMPEGGWQSFQEYVYKKLNKKYDSSSSPDASINGELKLEFSIDDEGQPYDFKVVHAPDNALANEAINAIRQGPKWIGADKGKKTRVTVKY